MRIEIIKKESDFLALSPLWNSVLQASDADVVFLTFEWLSCWWQYFGDGKRLFIVVARDKDCIVGIAPLIIAGRDRFRQLTPMGGQTTEYKDFIVSESGQREVVLKAMLQTIANEGGWDLFRLDGLREDSPNQIALNSLLPGFPRLRGESRESDVSPYIPINQPWETYWIGLKRGLRNDTQRLLKILNRERGTITYNQPTDLTEVDAYMDEFIKLHLHRRKEATRTYSVFEQPAMISFYKDLAKRLFVQKWLSLPVMLVSGEVAAVHFGFEYAGKYFYYMPVFSKEFMKYGVGKSLLLHLVKDCFGRGLKEFDLLLGSEAYKTDFNPEMRKLCSIAFYTGGFRGYAAETWFGRIRPKFESLVNADTPLQQIKWWVRRKKAGRQA